jgi:ribonuclease HI
MSKRDRIVWCDGSGPVGESKSCYYCVQTTDDVTVYEAGHDFDNNIVEYMAVIKALELVPNGGTIITDSQVIVNHLNGRQPCRVDTFRPYYERAKRMKTDKHAKIIWVSRKDNLAGKSLEQFIKMAKKKMRSANTTYIPLTDEDRVKDIPRQVDTFKVDLLKLITSYESRTGLIIEGINILRGSPTPEIKIYGQLGGLA